jgi:hypothetical protein
MGNLPAATIFMLPFIFVLLEGFNKRPGPQEIAGCKKGGIVTDKKESP